MQGFGPGRSEIAEQPAPALEPPIGGLEVEHPGGAEREAIPESPLTRYITGVSSGSTNVAKVVFKSLNTGRRGKAAPPSVGKKRVATPGGGWKTVFTLDVHSPSFEDGMLYVFRRNVAKARRENKRVLGVADFVPPKR